MTRFISSWQRMSPAKDVPTEWWGSSHDPLCPSYNADHPDHDRSWNSWKCQCQLIQRVKERTMTETRGSHTVLHHKTTCDLWGIDDPEIMFCGYCGGERR